VFQSLGLYLLMFGLGLSIIYFIDRQVIWVRSSDEASGRPSSSLRSLRVTPPSIKGVERAIDPNR